MNLLSKKHSFPNFGIVLSEVKFDLDQLLTDYQTSVNSHNPSEIDKLVNSRSYISKKFPIFSGGYQYIPVTQLNLPPEATKDLNSDISKESGKNQFRRGFFRNNEEYVPQLDDRLYTHVTKEVPTYTAAVLKHFSGVVSRTRFANLKAKQKIQEHVDNNLDHSVRIHIPIVSNPDCFFGVRRSGQVELKHLPADGHAYFVNTAFPHFVENNGSIDRIHLVINLNSQQDIEPLKLRNSPLFS